MTTRRDLLVGSLCLGGAGAAYALQPRRRISLLGRRSLASIVPYRFGSYTARDVSDLVAPREDSLAATLYGQTVGRVYSSSSGGPEIMMLLAYGDTQDDKLQLHRPEICYPFFGYAIYDNRPTEIALSQGVAIPGRSMIARAPDRQETILYWSRLGEYLPMTHLQQQEDRLATAMRGDIADGVLARFSVADADPAASIAAMGNLIPALIKAMAPNTRDVLIGSQRADALARVV
ncbi:MAG: EpsI family protein [Caulobacteraceae bacterium]|nr:EpsI family protein [Caulobacteraceae bacterium]